MLKFISAIDFYKASHPGQIPAGTTRILQNWTPRGGRIQGIDYAVFFGLQACLKYDFTDLANRTFFSQPKSDVLYDYKKMLDSSLGSKHGIGTDHIAALHDLQYLPLEFCALPEGTRVPYRVPMFTIENTHDDFAWLPGYVEPLLSSRLWLACTSATQAYRFRKLLDLHAANTGVGADVVDWQGHDFSLRGMASPEAAMLSGGGHLLSFKGTDNIPALEMLHDIYEGGDSIGGSVSATEHMVMMIDGPGGEADTVDRLLDLYPTGTIAQVGDTWNLWNFIDVIMRGFHDKIMNRDGKLVVRPDSGDPVLILTGDATEEPGTPAHKGVVQLLWDIFGGTRTSTGHKLLDSHVGTIYGDSITYERAQQICERLEAKGFASQCVNGIGSYTYNYVTRDTHGFALKATWAMVDGEERMLSKRPITDTGLKFSATGRLVVTSQGGSLKLTDALTLEEASEIQTINLLKPVWRDGRFIQRITLPEILGNLHFGIGYATRSAADLGRKHKTA